MITSRLTTRSNVRSVLIAIVSATCLVASATATSAGPVRAVQPARSVPEVPGYPPVAAPPVTAPGPLPVLTGSVVQDTATHVRRTDGDSSAAPKDARQAAAADSDAAMALAAAPTGKVALRALVVAVDGDDWGVDTWKATLDRVGAAYDVLHSRTTPLTADGLVRADGTGRYNAILLTNNSLLYPDDLGGFVSGLDANEWNLLWAYERDFGVRQATLYNSYGTWPEDYCMRSGSEGGVGGTQLPISLTAAGAAVFHDLNPTAMIPIQDSYVYRNQIDPVCDGQAVLTAGADVLGVLTTSTDGRERLALTFTSNQYLLQAHLLTYGLFRWASRGLFLGELRHSLNVDVDDWFNSSDHLYADGTLETDPGFQMTGHDAYNTRTQQTALRKKYPLATGFTMNIAYNGGDADMSATNQCYPDGGIDQLTSTTRCIRDSLRWINHTLTHPKMNFTDYATSKYEISQNLKVAQTFKFTNNSIILKTGEYSGLGVYHPDPTNDIDPPTDYNVGCAVPLCASNREMLRAARDLGVKYLHGNMSFKSHQPSCFNCSIVHGLMPALTVVPDWPTNIAYFSTTPEEETYFYNSFYGPNGKFPYWPRNLTYDELMDYEATQALNHMATGSIYSHTFHISNLRDYGGGRTLTTDWLDRVLAKYTALYKVPVQNPAWPALAKYTAHRNAHVKQLVSGVDAVYDAGANTVTVRSPVAGAVTVSGATTTGFTTYGSEVSAQITLVANTPVTFTPRLLG
jgi:hypothetical protein